MTKRTSRKLGSFNLDARALIGSVKDEENKKKFIGCLIGSTACVQFVDTRQNSIFAVTGTGGVNASRRWRMAKRCNEFSRRASSSCGADSRLNEGRL